MLAQHGAANIVLTVLVVALVVLAIDYAHLLYLHYKMASLQAPIYTYTSRQLQHLGFHVPFTMSANMG